MARRSSVTEETPRTESRRRVREEDDAPRRERSRSLRDRDEEEDDAPRRERGTSSTAGRGWSTFKKRSAATSSEYKNKWSVPEEPTIIKFLDEEPFAVYDQHWIDDAPKKKSFICLGDDCPLCDDIGDNPSTYALFNILVVDPDEDAPTLEFLQATASLAGKIEAFANEKRSQPINRVDVYFSLHRPNKKAAPYELSLVKGRDLEEDYDIVPFTEDELAPFEGKGMEELSDAYFVDSRETLKELVNLLDE